MTNQIQLLFERLRKLRSLLGEQVSGIFALCLVTGILWFFCETSFLFVFPVYLTSIGLLENAPTWLPSNLRVDIWIAFALLLGFGFSRSILYAWRTALTQISTTVFISNQRKSLLHFFLTSPPKLKTSEIANLFSEVVPQAGWVAGQISVLITSAFTSALFFLFLLKLAWLEALLSVTLLGLLALPLLMLTKQVNYLGQKIYRENLEVTEFLLMGLRNWTFLKVHRLTDRQVALGIKSLNLYLGDFRTFARLLGINAALPLFLGIIVVGIISIVGVYVTKTEALTLIGFFYLFLRMSQSASDASMALSQIKMNWVGITTLYHWHAIRLEQQGRQIDNSLKGAELKAKSDEIEQHGVAIRFDQVSFAWDTKGAWLFQNLNLSIKAGDILLISGPSGSGKSSLQSLVLGLNKPTHGVIKINELTPDSFFETFANLVSYVGPEPMLIPGTIRDNLTFGLTENLPDNEIYEILRKVDLEIFVRSLPEQLDTQLSERTELSTGQRQRLSLARALLRKPKLLILDEVTANLDKENNSRVIDIIAKQSQDMLVIAISHHSGFESIATQTLKLSAPESEVVNSSHN